MRKSMQVRKWLAGVGAGVSVVGILWTFAGMTASPVSAGTLKAGPFNWTVTLAPGETKSFDITFAGDQEGWVRAVGGADVDLRVRSDGGYVLGGDTSSSFTA